jgi:hypothetical protein
MLLPLVSEATLFEIVDRQRVVHLGDQHMDQEKAPISPTIIRFDDHS